MMKKISLAEEERYEYIDQADRGNHSATERGLFLAQLASSLFDLSTPLPLRLRKAGQRYPDQSRTVAAAAAAVSNAL